MPIYERVSLPQKYAQEFEEWLAERNGAYEAVRWIDDAVLTVTLEERWSQEVTEARIALAGFHLDQENPEVRAGIIRGVQTLVQEAYAYQMTRPFEEIVWEHVTTDIHNIFERNLVDEPPLDLGLVKKPNMIYFTSARDTTILPEDIILTLDKYGLTDGQQKTYVELGEKYDVSNTRVKNHVKKTGTQLGAQIRYLVGTEEYERTIFSGTLQE